MNGENRKRLFIGLACPSSERVSELLAVLAAQARQVSGLRPVPEENLHITLRFLGMVDAASIGLLSQAMTRGVASTPGLGLELRGIGFFRTAVWLGVEPRAELSRLASRLDQALAMVGVPGDDKPYAPHVTVARLRPGTRLKVSDLQARYGETDWCRFQANTVNLYESLTLPTGARYRVLATAPLAGQAGVE